MTFLTDALLGIQLGVTTTAFQRTRGSPLYYAAGAVLRGKGDCGGSAELLNWARRAKTCTNLLPEQVSPFNEKVALFLHYVVPKQTHCLNFCLDDVAAF